jgi:signal transduction histidine kinase
MRQRVKTGSFADFLELVRKSRREAALVGAAALILISLTAFSFWLTHRVLNDADTAHELNRYNAKLTKFLELLRTVESSQRGYLLTGDQAFLDPYNEISGLLAPIAKELREAAPEKRNITGKVTALSEPLRAKLGEMAKTVALAKDGQRDAAITHVKNGVGRELTDQIEGDVRLIQDESNALISKNEESTTRLENIKFFMDGIGALLIITFSFLSLWLLLRSHATTLEAQDELAKANADLEETVAQRTAALKRANEEIQRFAYIVSHDLRSPLVNIMGFTTELETLRTELFEKLAAANALAGSELLSKDFDEAFAFIKSSIARMDRLIAAILKISREGSRPLHPEPVDAKALVDGVVAGVAHQIREKEVNVIVGPLPAISTDRLALEQIFSNLIENAIKFLKASGQGKIRIDGFCRGAEIIYTVSDNGRGVHPKDHQRIFELFRRSGPQDVPGEGMGLAYVSALMRRLGGTVSVESTLGSGSTFRLTLPSKESLQKRMAA